MAKKPSEVERRLLMLGAALVGTNPKAARIVAEAMAEIERLKKTKRKKR